MFHWLHCWYKVHVSFQQRFQSEEDLLNEWSGWSIFGLSITEQIRSEEIRPRSDNANRTIKHNKQICVYNCKLTKHLGNACAAAGKYVESIHDWILNPSLTIKIYFLGGQHHQFKYANMTWNYQLFRTGQFQFNSPSPTIDVHLIYPIIIPLRVYDANAHRNIYTEKKQKKNTFRMEGIILPGKPHPVVWWHIDETKRFKRAKTMTVSPFSPPPRCNKNKHSRKEATAVEAKAQLDPQLPRSTTLKNDDENRVMTWRFLGFWTSFSWKIHIIIIIIIIIIISSKDINPYRVI